MLQVSDHPCVPKNPRKRQVWSSKAPNETELAALNVSALVSTIMLLPAQTAHLVVASRVFLDC